MSQGESEQAIGTAGTSTGRTMFAVLGGSLAWALHFLASYALVSVGCVAGWSATVPILVAGTVGLGAVALWSTLIAWREWRRTGGGMPWDVALSEPPGWYVWLMTGGVLLGITSTFTILLEGLGTLMLPLCGWNVR